jgi:hypothetical protein
MYEAAGPAVCAFVEEARKASAKRDETEARLASMVAS